MKSIITLIVVSILMLMVTAAFSYDKEAGDPLHGDMDRRGEETVHGDFDTADKDFEKPDYDKK